MSGVLMQASASANAASFRCRSSSSLSASVPLVARPHLASRRALQLVSSSNPHQHIHQTDRSEFEQLDVKHGQHQHQQQSDPRQQGPPRWRAWLGSIGSILPLSRRENDAGGPAADRKAWSWRFVLAQLRMLLLGCLAACMLMLVRYTAVLQARTAPKEVLYSQFVSMLDTGKVKAARLEAASSRLFFECHPTAEAVPPPPATSVSVAASSSSSKATASSSTSSVSAPVPEALQTAASAAAKPTLRRRFYIKLADKQDPLLVGKIIAAGRQ